VSNVTLSDIGLTAGNTSNVSVVQGSNETVPDGFLNSSGASGYISPASLGEKGFAAFHLFIMEHDNFSVASAHATKVHFILSLSFSPCTPSYRNVHFLGKKLSGWAHFTYPSISNFAERCLLSGHDLNDSGQIASRKSNHLQLNGSTDEDLLNPESTSTPPVNATQQTGPLMINMSDGSRWFLPVLKPLRSIPLGTFGMRGYSTVHFCFFVSNQALSDVMTTMQTPCTCPHGD